MAKSFVSAGVFTKEIDASFLGAGVGAIGAALIGTAPKGPAFVPVAVETNSEFEEFFGELDDDYNLGYAARAYLRNSGKANIVRVLGPAGRTVNGSAVNPGYSAESMWGVVAITGSATANLMALIEITGSGDLIVEDLTSDVFKVTISGAAGDTSWDPVEVSASMMTSSANYIEKVLSTDPTKFSTLGYYLRDTYDYAFKKATTNGSAVYASMSYGITSFAQGFNSGSTTWIKSQLFGGSEYNLFRFHTLGHGEAENGRFKVSIKNIRVSAAPEVNDFGKFDVEVRDFDDTDTVRSVIETWPNLTLDSTDPNYIGRVIGDKYWKWTESREKMVENGNFENKSKFVRVEMVTGSIPDAALPWGFQGYAKPALMYISASSGEEGTLGADVNDILADLPLVADLLDKATQAESTKKLYWGVETSLSGSVKGRLTLLPTMTGSDTAFSLYLVSGSAVGNLKYNASNPSDNWKTPGATTAHTVLEPDHAKFTLPFAFGFDGFDRRLEDPLDNDAQLLTVSQLGSQALRQAVDIVSDPDFIDINLLAIPGIYSSRVVDYGMDAMRDRSDAFYVIDVSGTTPTAISQEVKGRGFDNNYAGCYYPSIRVWDDVNSIVKSLPASVPAIGAIAYNDRVAYPWWAPAGLNRAGLSREVIGFDVLGVDDQLTQAERDDLYEARINPIARFPDVPQGVIWGQKTLQLKSSALDRINVRRLLIRAKKLIASAAKFLVFEPANATTMTRFRQLVNPILADIQQKQGLETFKVQMDETTSTPELIDRNILAGKVWLVPTRTAEFISVDFVISPSGASFEE
jgi:hypothetical protein